MPPPYRNPHWQVFAGIPFVPAGPVGYIPADWVRSHSLTGIPPAAVPIPVTQLDRAAVRAICRNPAYPVLLGYVCAMAWGLQGVGQYGPPNVARAWCQRAGIEQSLIQLRNGGLTRAAAYNLFRTPRGNNNIISGLGPAYFTKLLYFFSPTNDFYIMDRRTGQAVDVLTGTWVVTVTDEGGINANRSSDYQAYCDEVDLIARELSVTGEQAEEMLWAWRNYNWPGDGPL